MRIAVPDTIVMQKCFGIWNRFSLWLQHLVKKTISRYLKVSQGTGPVSQATGLEFEYLKVSQATGLEFEYLKVSQGTGPVSQATGLRRWYLKLRGWNLSISSYGAGIKLYSRCSTVHGLSTWGYP